MRALAAVAALWIGGLLADVGTACATYRRPVGIVLSAESKSGQEALRARLEDLKLAHRNAITSTFDLILNCGDYQRWLGLFEQFPGCR